MLQKSHGNMYPWVTHMHSHLGGECPHKCVYCYVDNPRFGRPPRYRGPLRLIVEELSVAYGSGKTIFMEHCNDFLANDVPGEFITKILSHCRRWPDNTYVFQSKNPRRFNHIAFLLPPGSILGTTIETNREIPGISVAPRPEDRMLAMVGLGEQEITTFVTIEPVLDFDVDILAEWIGRINPFFVNLGADSKGHGLPEPSIDKILALTDKLMGYGIELKEKHNLERLRGGVFSQ